MGLSTKLPNASLKSDALSLIVSAIFSAASFKLSLCGPIEADKSINAYRSTGCSSDIFILRRISLSVNNQDKFMSANILQLKLV